LVSPSGIRYRQYDHEDNAQLAVSLLRAKKQIHAEALPMFYGQNKFIFAGKRFSWPKDPAADLSSFLKQIGSARSHIRHIALDACFTRGRLRTALHLLKHARQLQTFELGYAALIDLGGLDPESADNAKTFLPWLKTLRKARVARGESMAIRDIFRMSVFIRGEWESFPIHPNPIAFNLERLLVSMAQLEKFLYADG
jgi:hypothetical protein